jgi:hypothetical protein
MIRPRREAKVKLVAELNELVDENYGVMASPMRARDSGRSLCETLMDMSRRLRGWGNQYSFCNDPEGSDFLDSKIDALIRRCIGGYDERRQQHPSAADWRRLIGVHLLADSKYDPIIRRKSRKASA